MTMSSKPLPFCLVVMQCAIGLSVPWGVAQAEESCRLERPAASTVSLPVAPLAAPDLRVDLQPGVAVVAELSVDRPARVVALGSLELAVDPESLPLHATEVVSTVGALSSTLNPVVPLGRPRLSKRHKGAVTVEATLADRIDVRGVDVPCRALAIGEAAEAPLGDEILSQVNTVYPRVPELRLRTAHPLGDSKAPPHIVLTARDPEDLPLVVESQHEHTGLSVVRLHTKLGVVIRGTALQSDLTLRPRFNVLRVSTGALSSGKAGRPSTRTHRRSHAGRAKVAAGTPVRGGPKKVVWARVSEDRVFDVIWHCHEKTVRIRPEDIEATWPMTVPLSSVSFPDGAPGCRAKGGTR